MNRTRACTGALGASTLLLLVGLVAGGAPARAQAPGIVGVRSCDEYVRIYRCMVTKLPPSAQASAAQAVDRMVAAWRSAIRSGGRTARTNLSNGCAKVVTALRGALNKNAKFAACVGGTAPPPAAPPAKGNPPAAPPAAKGGAGASGSLIGVASCDRMLTRYRCFMSNLPAGARSSARTAYQRLDRSLRTAVANARRKGRLEEAEKGCAAADHQLTRTLANNQFGRTCAGATVAAPPPNTPTPTTDPAEITPDQRGIQGIPACASYVRMTRCFVSFLPGDAQRYAAKSLQDSVARWTGLLARGQRAAVIRDCTQILARTRGIIAQDSPSASCARLR